ncbi:type II toxin-antitoxin system HicB family antitoxin [Patescibacteria group bacterium]|nr:type II toxin-antitoxin system HicB family antitoxin [Patescibacteria group bacterium]MBU2509457.1 type II toxin-antitoxin system HicB family antitoxin [Patescibacteria group bacterium]
MQFNAVYQKHGKWYLGWVEEIPGVNTQGKTLKEAKENLKEALALVLEVNKALIEKDRPHGRTIRERIQFQNA